MFPFGSQPNLKKMNQEKDHICLCQWEETPQLSKGALSGQGYLSHALPWVPGPHPAARICLGTQDPSNLGLLQLLDPRRNEDNAVSLLPSLIWITDRWIFKLREYSTFAWLNSGFAWAQQSARVQCSELEGQREGGCLAGRTLTCLDAESHEGVKRIRPYSLNACSDGDEPLD